LLYLSYVQLINENVDVFNRLDADWRLYLRWIR